MIHILHIYIYIYCIVFDQIVSMRLVLALDRDLDNNEGLTPPPRGTGVYLMSLETSVEELKLSLSRLLPIRVGTPYHLECPLIQWIVGTPYDRAKNTTNHTSPIACMQSCAPECTTHIPLCTLYKARRCFLCMRAEIELPRGSRSIATPARNANIRHTLMAFERMAHRFGVPTQG